MEGRTSAQPSVGAAPLGAAAACSYCNVKYSSEVSCWLNTKQLSVIIYEHKAGVSRSNTEKFTQPLSTLHHEGALALAGARVFEVSCNLLIP